VVGADDGVDVSWTYSQSSSPSSKRAARNCPLMPEGVESQVPGQSHSGISAEARDELLLSEPWLEYEHSRRDGGDEDDDDEAIEEEVDAVAADEDAAGEGQAESYFCRLSSHFQVLPSAVIDERSSSTVSLPLPAPMLQRNSRLLLLLLSLAGRVILIAKEFAWLLDGWIGWLVMRGVRLGGRDGSDISVFSGVQGTHKQDVTSTCRCAVYRKKCKP